MKRDRTRGMEKLDWQRSEEQDIFVAKIDIKGGSGKEGRKCDIPRETASGE